MNMDKIVAKRQNSFLSCIFLGYVIHYIIRFYGKGAVVLRRIWSILMLMAVILSLAVSATAATTISKGTISAAVTSDGSCQITADLLLHLDKAVEELSFPVPANARGVTLNGQSAWTTRSGDSQLIKLDRLVGSMAGDITLRIQYTLPNTVNYDEEGKLILTLPLMSGFLFPVDRLDFTVTLPGVNTAKPYFSSSYFQQSIEEDMTFSANGSMITGSVGLQLKDRETLTMTLEVSEEMFPQNPIRQWSMGAADVAMIILGVLAWVYWAFFLRCAPFLRSRSTQPPEGYCAGELNCAITGQGMDLTMMVMTWAQLGYLLIHVEDSGRVILHKRMEMGNERSPAELRLFQKLFGNRISVDGTGYHYASLCRKAAAGKGDVQDLFRRNNGNPRPFRLLCALVGLLGGVSIGYVLAGDALLGILIIAVLAILGFFSAWFMQTWAMDLHRFDKTRVLIGFGLALIWIILGAIAGMAGVAACIVGVQLLASLFWLYGGRRTITGRRTVGQIFGFRSFLKGLSRENAQKLLNRDPDYFYAMAPYAIALGVSRPFARAFGKRRLHACTYLTTGMDGHMNAAEWNALMERTVRTLNARQKKLPFERLLGR